MILKPVEQITKADIDALITEKRAEAKTLEYKMKLPDRTDDAKKEFLADISSFANASGGDIIYGIEPDKDANGKTNGEPNAVVPITGANPDEIKLRLEHSIRDGIAPRLPVQILAIKGWNDNGFIVLIRIPKSFASPHMVTRKNTSRFYARNSSGKYQLDVGEIRNAFLATDSQAERIKCFREDRLAKILADETPVKLSSPYRTVLHLIPLGNFLHRERIDLSDTQLMQTSFYPIDFGGSTPRHNLDGFMSYDAGSGTGYCQVFHDGTVEAVNAKLIGIHGQRYRPFIPSGVYEQKLIQACQKYMCGYKALGVAPPIAVMLSLVGCKGVEMLLSQARQWLGNPTGPIDRDVAAMPEITIENLDTAELPRALKPIFDSLWQACGWPRSMNYDAQGNWAPMQ